MPTYTDIPAKFRQLILSTGIYGVVGENVFYPDRPQNVDLNTILPCIILGRVGGIDDTETTPIATEIWSVLIQGKNNEESIQLCNQIDMIMRNEVARAIAPNATAPGILSVRKISGPFVGKDEDTGLPYSLSNYLLRVLLSV